MNWDWPDFWGFLMPDRKRARRPDQPEDRDRRSALRWGTATGKILMTLVIVLLFGGIAVWIILAVVRFFRWVYGVMDSLAP